MGQWELPYGTYVELGTGALSGVCPLRPTSLTFLTSPSTQEHTPRLRSIGPPHGEQEEAEDGYQQGDPRTGRQPAVSEASTRASGPRLFSGLPWNQAVVRAEATYVHASNTGFTHQPAPNARSLLRTCRRIRAEIGDTWLGQVLFSFEDYQTMLNKLTALPIDSLAKIRHLRTNGDIRWMLRSPDGVLEGRGGAVGYGTLSGLIAEGDGWKELRYLCHDSTMLGFAIPSRYIGTHLETSHSREPQPNERAGHGLGMKEKTRVAYEQKLISHGSQAEEAPYGTKEDKLLSVAGEREKELLVIVRRGRGVDYQVKKPDKSWKESRPDPPSDDGDENTLGDGGEEIDSYDNVDDYIWNALP
ncbi:Uu.00g124250.m01.CDS01 [Anthostomella pinea]|uniref:Uu.00g124250.m01.CDS01 n=1 Tax=Anthostomella pinea TaxID=933095 RepID=A0AAI8VI37_9PEZI|nr:Uu.00g124250.m01.CDS01 [Anthostomella pinea]